MSAGRAGVALALALVLAPAAGAGEVPLWGRFEVAISNPRQYADPYADVTLEVEYQRPDGSRVAFWGFYDGAGVWRLRFLPDQTGPWSYRARFSDGSPGAEGAFRVVPSRLPGLVSGHAGNPIWFGTRDGAPWLVRGLHVGDRFFAANWDDEARRAFLDWAQAQGYNLLSIASHLLNRDARGRGAGWDTPRLWPLDAEEYRRLERGLDELARRRMLVFPFAGFFGRDSAYPVEPGEQRRYLRYALARIGPYWNVLLNVAGPEPRATGYLADAEVRKLGGEIARLDVFGHLLSVHNAPGDDRYRDAPWAGYGVLQGPKTTDLARLSRVLLANHHPDRPLLAQETLWSGNKHHPDYSDEQLRKNAWVVNFSAASLVFGDMDSDLSDGAQGNSSAGFSGTMELPKRLQHRHDVVAGVWDFMEAVPFARLRPRQDLVDRGYCLAEPGRLYLVYLPEGGSVDVRVSGGPYEVRWIDGADPAERRSGGLSHDGRGLEAPRDGDDWTLWLEAREN